MAEAARLLATVTGQDIEETDDGRFQIFEGTAPDRVISTVDPEARHGHKTAAHGFDGYKVHVATDPDSEVICAAEVSSAATADAAVGPTLLADLVSGEDAGEQTTRAAVYGDSAYGTGAHLAWLDAHRLTPMVKTSLRPHRAGGSARTSSGSTSPRGRSPARRGSPWRSPRPAAAEAGPGSVERAACARYARPAPAPSPVGWSPSTPMRRSWPPPALASAIPPGGPTTEPPDQGRTQARPPVAPPPRRPPRPGPRAGARGPGLQAPGRSGQPGPVRRPWAAVDGDRLAAPARLTAAAAPGRPPALPPQRAESLQLVEEHRPSSQEPPHPHRLTIPVRNKPRRRQVRVLCRSVEDVTSTALRMFVLHSYAAAPVGEVEQGRHEP